MLAGPGGDGDETQVPCTTWPFFPDPSGPLVPSLLITEYLYRAPVRWAFDRDASIKAIADQDETLLHGSHAAIRTSRPPNNAEVMYSFIILRAQFIQKYYRNVWNHTEIKAEGKIQGEENKFGFWDLFKGLSGKQRIDYLTHQLVIMIYSLGATLALLSSFLVLMLISLILMAIAGLAKFAAVFVMGVFLLVLPIAYFIKGLKALVAGLNLLLSYLFLKGAVILVIWLGFFLLEGVVLQSYLELAANYPNLQEILNQYKPGFLYTAGQDILFINEQSAQMNLGYAAMAKTLLSMIVILLATIYITFKLPSILAAMFGVQSLGDDLFSSVFFIGGAAVSAGAALAGKFAGGAKSANKLKGV